MRHRNRRHTAAESGAARFAISVLLALVTPALIGCGPSDPRERILADRARWSVEPVSLVPKDEALHVTVLVDGPVKSSLNILTVRFTLVDASGEAVRELWEPLDVSSIERGAPTEMLVRISGDHAGVDGFTVEVVTDPTDEQARQIVELQ